MLVALEKFGKLSFAQVAAPAMEHAGNGFPIGEEFAGFLKDLEGIHALWPTSREFFYPNGRPPKAGEIVKMPALRRTLEEMAGAEKNARGNRAAKLQAVHDIFYKGSIARRIAAFSEANGGL